MYTLTQQAWVVVIDGYFPIEETAQHVAENNCYANEQRPNHLRMYKTALLYILSFITP